MHSKVEKILKGSKSYVIRHSLIDGKPAFQWVELHKKKKEIILINSVSFHSFEELLKTVPKKAGITLIIDNEHVITRWVTQATREIEGLTSSAFPNIRQEDFYQSGWKTPEGVLLSICRKSYIEECINTYISKEIHVHTTIIGNVGLSCIIPFLSNGVFFSENLKFSIEHNQVTHLEPVSDQPVSESYLVNGIHVPGKYLSSFSSGLTYFIGTSENQLESENLSLYNQQLHGSWLQQQWFSQGIKILVAGVLLILLINFYFFNYYFNKVNELEQTAGINRNTKDKLTELNQKVTETQKVVENILSNNTSKTSWYTNSIVHSIPETISFSEITYQPLLKKLRAKEAVTLQTDIITLTGNALQSSDFSNWVEALEELSWVQKAEVNAFSDLPDQTSSFTLTIYIHDGSEQK